MDVAFKSFLSFFDANVSKKSSLNETILNIQFSNCVDFLLELTSKI